MLILRVEYNRIMTKNIIIAIFMTLCCHVALSAQTDSTALSKPLLARQLINLNFPRTRNLNIQMETGFPGTYKIRMPEYWYNEKGSIKRFTSVSINGNFSLLRKGKFTVAGGASYSYRNIKFSDFSASTGKALHGLKKNFMYLDLMLPLATELNCLGDLLLWLVPYSVNFLPMDLTLGRYGTRDNGIEKLS